MTFQNVTTDTLETTHIAKRIEGLTGLPILREQIIIDSCDSQRDLIGATYIYESVIAIQGEALVRVAHPFAILAKLDQLHMDSVLAQTKHINVRLQGIANSFSIAGVLKALTANSIESLSWTGATSIQVLFNLEGAGQTTIYISQDLN